MRFIRFGVVGPTEIPTTSWSRIVTEHLWRPAIADANYQNAGVYEADRSTATAYEESRVIEKTQKLLPASSRPRRLAFGSRKLLWLTR